MATSNHVKFARRLLNLAAFLENLPKERFYFGTWAGTEEKPFGGDGVHLSCGTTACALGWCATLPWARAAGMRLLRAGYQHCPLGALAGIALQDELAADPLMYVGLTSARNASNVVLGLSAKEHECIFFFDHYVNIDGTGLQDLPINATAAQVAANIRTLVSLKHGYESPFGMGWPGKVWVGRGRAKSWNDIMGGV